MENMLTGLFGGSFNPPHIGHLLVITDILAILPFKKVFFIPTRIPPHKDSLSLIEGMHRVHMLNTALQNIEKAEISTFEIDNEEISYSYITISHFLERYSIKPAHLFFILGTDAFLLIKTWKKYPEILDMCNFLIITRPMYGREENLFKKFQKYYNILPFRKFVPGNSKTGIYFIDNFPLDISSSMIRERIKKGLSIKYLVPPGIEDYILNNRLYQ